MSSPAVSVIPRCSIFGVCGGCRYQDIDYAAELKIKEREVFDLFHKTLDCSLIQFKPIVASPQEYAYRNRLDLKLKRTKEGKVLIGFTPNDGKGVAVIESCPISREEISDFIPQLKKEASLRLTDKYRLANLVVRSGDEKRVLWGGIGKRSLEMKEADYFFTVINGRKIFYSLDTFFQANLSILPLLFDEIASADVIDRNKTFLDLYGGVGLFSVGLAGLYKDAFLIESSADSLRMAHFNKAFHKLDDLHVVEGTVEAKFSEVEARASLQDTVVMIDPPRNGLTSDSLTMLTQLKTISSLIYLSCSPETLVRDLVVFQKEGWKISKVVPFDFFPKTKHIETLVFLRPN